MNKKRLLLLVAFFIIIGGYLIYNYMYQDHRNIETEVSQVEITGPYLLERFKNDDASDILNSTITVTGVVTLIEEGAVTIDGSVYCSMDNTSGLKISDAIKIKGRCIGYDDLFEIVKLDQCSLIK